MGGCGEIQPRYNSWLVRKELFRVERTAYSTSFILILQKTNIMKASNRLIEKIKEFEGYKSKAYRCPAGVWTCGYGHTRKVTSHTSCTPAKAEEWLLDDLKPIEIFLSASPHFTKTQGRFDACVDFCFNLGIATFRKSTLYRLILQSATDEAILNQFSRWIYANGKPLEGLKKRRAFECQCWQE